MIERRPARSLFGRLVGGPAGFRRRLERLGPTWVKMGQYLALQPDLISREYADELMRLFDRVEPAPWAVIRQVIREDLGADPEGLFATIDPEPIGSGAVAQTYRAQLKDGTEVAVKVQRPGVKAQVERDLGRIRTLISVLARAGILRAVSPRDLADELRGWMLAEVDFRNSLANVTVLHRVAADSPIERIPEPFPDFCGPRVETTELVRGVPLSAVLDVQRGGTGGIWAEAVSRIDREAVAENLLTATLRQIFRYRFFHADVHPGNLFVFEDSSIGYVDFGLCVAWDGTMRERLLRYLDAVYRSDVEQMYRAASEILVPSEDTDMTAFRTEFFSESWRWMSRLRASNETRTGASAANEPSPIAQWMIAVMQAARRNGLRVPSVVVSIYRALLVAESVAHQLEASADLRSAGRRFFERLRTEELYRSLDPSNLQQIALSGVQLQRDGPGQMRQLLANMVDGSFTVTVHTFEAPRVRRAWNRRLKMVVAAALSLGVAVILTRPDLPAELTTLLVAILAALYLTIAVLWARLR